MQVKNDNPNTDGTNLIKQEVFEYWNKDFYKPLSHYTQIHDPLGEHKRFEYSTENIVNKDYNKSYYMKRREEILEKAKTKITCECGCVVQLFNMIPHKKTKKHVRYLEMRQTMMNAVVDA